jgi:hypothetical protein
MTWTGLYPVLTHAGGKRGSTMQVQGALGANDTDRELAVRLGDIADHLDQLDKVRVGVDGVQALSPAWEMANISLTLLFEAMGRLQDPVVAKLVTDLEEDSFAGVWQASESVEFDAQCTRAVVALRTAERLLMSTAARNHGTPLAALVEQYGGMTFQIIA